jgi:hypothetical protein
MAERRVVPASAIDIAEAKRGSNVSAVVPIGMGTELYIKAAGAGRAGNGGRIIVRGTHVKPTHRLGSKAKAMRDCAGKKGCDFKQCLESAGVSAPRSIRKACGT